MFCRIADPVDAVEPLYVALANGAVELLLGFLGLDDLLQRYLEQTRRVVDVLGDKNVARQAIAHLAGLHDQRDDLVAEPIRRRPQPRTEREHANPH